MASIKALAAAWLALTATTCGATQVYQLRPLNLSRVFNYSSPDVDFLTPDPYRVFGTITTDGSFGLIPQDPNPFVQDTIVDWDVTVAGSVTWRFTRDNSVMFTSLVATSGSLGMRSDSGLQLITQSQTEIPYKRYDLVINPLRGSASWTVNYLPGGFDSAMMPIDNLVGAYQLYADTDPSERAPVGPGELFVIADAIPEPSSMMLLVVGATALLSPGNRSSH